MSSIAADLLLTDLDVYCNDGRGTWGREIAIKDGRILAIGASDGDLAEFREGPNTEVLSMPGRMALPGFQDAHIHSPFAGRNRLRVWLNDVVGRDEYLQIIADYAKANPDEPWIVGGGWAMESFPGGLPRKEDLDAIVPDRPVFLFNKDVHGAWVNSVALERAGITKDTADPSDGRIERDADTGEPTGVLHEGAAYTMNDSVLPLPSQREWEAAILNAQQHLHGLGITAWQDAWITPGTHDAYRELAHDGRLTAHVVGALWWDRHQGLEQVPQFLAQRENGMVGNYHATTIKIMTDGVLENFTGALLEPYCDGCGGHTDNYGLSYVEPDLLNAAVTELDRLGFQVHMHAIGDRAVRNSLDAVAEARQANGASDRRHHIAHVQIVHPDDVARFGELGVVANCQPLWAQSDPQMEELTVPFLGAGPGRHAVSVWIHAAHGRPTRGGQRLVGHHSQPPGGDGRDGEPDEIRRNRTPPHFCPRKRVALDVAVAAFTSGTAYVNHDEHDSGRLAPGMRADIAVLDRNIFRPPRGDGGGRLS